MGNLVRCIYCPTMIDPTQGAGDHIIPRAFGVFRKDLRFRQICRTCNNRIGSSEEQLIRCGPEKLLRYLMVSSSSKTHARTETWSVGARGMPPPKVHIRNAEAGELLAEMHPELNAATTPDQLTIIDEQEGRHHIQLFPQMSPQSLRSKFEALHIHGTVSIFCNWSMTHDDKYMRLVKEAFGKEVSRSYVCNPVGVHQVPFRFTFKVDDNYFRAIAKIAFHYYLTQTSLRKGTDECFVQIREFILNGGDISPFFQGVPEVFHNEPPSGMAPSQWAHILAADEDSSQVVGFVRLFYGPHGKPNDYHVLLARPSFRLILPRSAWAHAYTYDRTMRSGKVTGQVERLTIRR